MYQLSHLLSEQKSLLGALSATSISGEATPVITEVENKDKGNVPGDENRQKLASILEKVEGCKVGIYQYYYYYSHSTDEWKSDTRAPNF